MSRISTSTQSLFTGPHSDFFLAGYCLLLFRLSDCLCLSALLRAVLFFLPTYCLTFLSYLQRVSLLFQTVFSFSYISRWDELHISLTTLRSELCSPAAPGGSSFFLLNSFFFFLSFLTPANLFLFTLLNLTKVLFQLKHYSFTYKGISRVKHPDWSGWKIIDSIYHSTDLWSIKLLNSNSSLQTAVKEFYHSEFWKKIQGDLLPTQLIADELLESSINLGVPTASEILQRTINILNINISLYPDITVDGIIGSQTLSALNKCILANGEKLICNLLNFYQAKRYIKIMERDRTQEIFIGWFSRIAVIK